MATPAARNPRPIRYRDTVEKNDSFLKTNSRSKRKLVNHRATGKCTTSGWYRNGIQLYSTPSVRRLSRKCHVTVAWRVARSDEARRSICCVERKIRLSPHQEVFVSDPYTFPPAPSSDAIEWPGTLIGAGNVITRTKTRTAVHDKSIDRIEGRRDALVDAAVGHITRRAGKEPLFRNDVVIHGIRVRATPTQGTSTISGLITGTARRTGGSRPDWFHRASLRSPSTAWAG